MAHYEVTYCRSHRTFVVKILGSSGRKSTVQAVLIVLVESGLVYLGFQVSDSPLLRTRKIFKVLTVLTDGVLDFVCAQCS